MTGFRGAHVRLGSQRRPSMAPADLQTARSLEQALVIALRANTVVALASSTGIDRVSHNPCRPQPAPAAKIGSLHQRSHADGVSPHRRASRRRLCSVV
jgi:hypothetical protein